MQQSLLRAGSPAHLPGTLRPAPRPASLLPGFSVGAARWVQEMVGASFVHRSRNSTDMQRLSGDPKPTQSAPWVADAELEAQRGEVACHGYTAVSDAEAGPRALVLTPSLGPAFPSSLSFLGHSVFTLHSCNCSKRPCRAVVELTSSGNAGPAPGSSL